jgi:hypothetical protein
LWYIPGRLEEGSIVKVSEPALWRLSEMAAWAGLPVNEVLDHLINEHYDRKFWEAVNAGYAALRADPAEWAKVEAERKLWDGTLMDGLDHTERWTEDRSAVPPSDQERAS